MRNENGENNSCGEYTMIVTLNYGYLIILYILKAYKSIVDCNEHHLPPIVGISIYIERSCQNKFCIYKH